MTNTTYSPSDFIAALERAGDRDLINRRVERRFVPRIGTVIVTFDTVNVNDGDLSYLGSWSNIVSDYAVDATEQVILGKYQTARYTLTTDEAKGLSTPEFEARLWDKATTDGWAFSGLHNDQGYFIDIDDLPELIVDESIAYPFLEVTGYPLLFGDTQYVSQRDYNRYFHAERVDVTAPDFFKHIERDYDRFLDYGSFWNFVGCVVTVYFKGFEIDSSSVWGIESDSDTAIFTETFNELYADCDVWLRVSPGAGCVWAQVCRFV